MRTAPAGKGEVSTPQFVKDARELARYIKTLSEKDIVNVMKVSPVLAAKTSALMKGWTSAPSKQSVAIDSFLGDIYSGFQAEELNGRDRAFAQKHLRIISGLYGLLKPLDGIAPYRLEMAYRLPDKKFNNLYEYWGSRLAESIGTEPIVSLTSGEYGKAIFPHLKNADVVTPKFLTVSPKTKEPTFVVVHAKIARGAFARWLIKERVQTFSDLPDFSELNYRYSKKLSTTTEPVFVAQEFGGIGLSVRLLPR